MLQHRIDRVQSTSTDKNLALGTLDFHSHQLMTEAPINVLQSLNTTGSLVAHPLKPQSRKLADQIFSRMSLSRNHVF
jgi:hypothetical protein